MINNVTTFKITSFSLTNDEKNIFCGSLLGSIHILDTKSFKAISILQIHVGSIEVVAVHPTIPLAAAMSMDQSVSLINIEDPLNPKLVDRFNFRDETCSNDKGYVPPNYSLSQALSFHPQKPRLITRSGNAGLLELSYEKGHFEVLNCTRLHGDTDLVTAKYILNGELILTGAGGDIVLSNNGVEISRWSIGEYNHHWFEQIDDYIFLVACDELHLILLNIKEKEPMKIGEKFMRDDFEHVTYNHISKCAYACGFDGDIYQVDPINLNVIDIKWRAPYKLRWIKTLKDNPNILIAYSFNGGLYKVDLNTGKEIMKYRYSPFTIWTSIYINSSLYLTGEGPTITKINLNKSFESDFVNKKRLSYIDKGSCRSFTKRIEKGINNSLILGQKNGEILEIRSNVVTKNLFLNEEIRDIVTDLDKNQMYVCTEQSNVYNIDLNSFDIINKYFVESNQPIWSLALNKNQSLLAIGERRGDIIILDSSTFKVNRHLKNISSRPKRMKWFQDNLIFVRTGKLMRYDYELDVLNDYVDDCENTIEDFIWNIEYQYLLLIGYRTEVILCDLSTGKKLHKISDQVDFCKGITWLKNELMIDSYPLTFMTYGRTGELHLYRIHNDRIVAVGTSHQNIIGVDNSN